MTKPNLLPEWKALEAQARNAQKVHMRDLFKADPSRGTKHCIEAAGIYLDYSKNNVNSDTLDLLVNLLQNCGFEKMREKFFSGEKINITEKRAVLHTALRYQGTEPVMVDGKDVMPRVRAVLAHIKEFTAQVRSGQWKGHSGRPIKTIVNIGIGGSDLGPVMVCEALKHYANEDSPKAYFVSNVDGTHIAETLLEVTILRGTNLVNS
ncbi:glucose-6-phosphate isomerase [Fibrobacteria bacterium R8-3-H12]